MNGNDITHSPVDGFKDFHRRYYEEDPTLFQELVQKGQNPRIMMIACSDSRMSPSLTFNIRPGELFVVAQRRQSRAARGNGWSSSRH